MLLKNLDTFTPKTRNDWRLWLSKHHELKTSIWLVLYKKNSGKPTISWEEAVEEALCFGWIDSTRRQVDDHKFIQYFGKRKPASTWSKINKEKVERLIAEGLMERAGLASIEIAKQNGSWTILDAVEELVIPADLAKEFRAHKGSKTYFMSLSKSVKKMMLHWVMMAKRPETREKRVIEIALLAGQGKKPKLF